MSELLWAEEQRTAETAITVDRASYSMKTPQNNINSRSAPRDYDRPFRVFNDPYLTRQFTTLSINPLDSNLGIMSTDNFQRRDIFEIGVRDPSDIILSDRLSDGTDYVPSFSYGNNRNDNSGSSQSFNYLASATHIMNRPFTRPFNPNATPFMPSSQLKFISNNDDSAQNLRDRLKKQLEDEQYECMICCQTIKANQWIWTCQKCFHMFHFNQLQNKGCINQWATKSFECDTGWRCPGCQNISFGLPKCYRCFCGKKRNPPTQCFPEMPHSCNSICGKSRTVGCPHPCSEICHPGPCPECPIMSMRSCNCGAETKALRCGILSEFKCSKICSKMLNCGLHSCKSICHPGDCRTCEHIIVQFCHCGSEKRSVSCGHSDKAISSYSCGSACKGFYDCGIHRCEQKCHAKSSNESCGSCILSVEKIKYCPCGRTLISSLTTNMREKCTDAIPTCGQICDKLLNCGPKERQHRCKELCHMGSCPPCQNTTFMECRCKAIKKAIPCKEVILYSGAATVSNITMYKFFSAHVKVTFIESNPFLCERYCKKTKSCWNHRCQEVCCIDKEHLCLQMCNKLLSCGNHNCDRLCHRGKCPVCLVASFEEQYCLCGATFREPPVPCGAPLPSCDQLCSREHACEHSPTHKCHSDPECPPCTVLTQKPCYGNHEVRSNIPCYLNDVSCGKPCGLDVSCGIHRCPRICHPGSCLTGNDVCKQPCPIRRIGGESCDHPCALPCHGSTPCPPSICLELIRVTCLCLRKSSEMRCVDVEKVYRKMLALKIAQSEGQQQTEIKILKRSLSADKYKCLPCDADCQRILRNKRIANALNIAIETNSTDIAPPIYTDFLIRQLTLAHKHVLQIENALISLVNEVDLEQSSTVRTHTFHPMVSELRRIIHEYAKYFRIKTVSHDAEPQRNVVAIAKRLIYQKYILFNTYFTY
ncbi:unnamed protein product [Dracunculus medinensis]|uniref:R3H domain-containing protein n=1 Tax=Dracunculus medinensis TaxID=318479 RepID=A0A0N4UL40_DRAME|nr:unnamed protein product [Dracunculus medinensis]